MEIVKSLQSQKVLKSILVVLVGSILLTISAKIKIPFYPVPMTMQTFVVLFLGISFGYKIGLATVTLYLLEGIFGLPVFANSPEKGIGLIYFTGPTMGYLIGFLLAVYSAGVHKDLINFTNYKYINALTVFSSLIVSVSFIYILGLLWLGYLIGWDKPIFKLGAQPFLLAELFKLFLLTALYPWIIKLNKII
jgi:biotin transport system substrate-specific component|tara:strand:+ start:76 stop:651 length:576 start_codon:yes stop_codon:yes gene_type:complete